MLISKYAAGFDVDGWFRCRIGTESTDWARQVSDTREYDHTLDAAGLNCPLPILKTKKALVTIEPGETLHVVATDPGSVADFKAFAKQTGHPLTDSWQEAEVYHFVLRKSEPRPR